MPSEQTYTIGDVSQQTGVAAVTLRAWERRYGLIKPLRTPKGHRLYSRENIQDIQHVLSWLNRGVAISKVSALLASGTPPKLVASANEQWTVEQEGLLAAITLLKQPGLDQRLDRLNKATPFITLCEYVYQPLQTTLVQRWQQQPLGYQLEQQLWQQGWQRQTLVMALRAGKQKTLSHCCLINLDDGRASLDYSLLHALLLQAGTRVIVFDAVKDLAGLTRLNSNTAWPLIFFADQRLNQALVNQLPKFSTRWQESILCAGRMSDIHREKLASLTLDSVGGSASDVWQSAVMKTWLEKIKS
jgi:MerR family transcriptional regulator, light-induced transcriptional regulator